MLKTGLCLAVLGLMLHWDQVMGIPGERRDIRPQLYQEEDYEIYKNYPRSGWSYLRPSRSLPQFSWSFFKDEDDVETLTKKRLDTLEKKQMELMELVKKLEQGEPIGGRSNVIENRDDSVFMESLEANEAQAMTDDSGTSENTYLGSLENLKNSNTKRKERDEISFSKIENNVKNDSVDPTNKLLPVSQNDLSTVTTNDPLTKVSQDYEKDQTNIGLTNKIAVTESNLVGLVQITNPTKGNNFPEAPKESYQNFQEEQKSAPILADNNKTSDQDLSVNWEGLPSSYNNPPSSDSKRHQIKGTRVSRENQDPTEDADDQSPLGFDRTTRVVRSDIFGEFLSNHKEKDGTRMERIRLSNDFEKVHDLIHNFEKNKNSFETLSRLAKKNENKGNGPYDFFQSLDKKIQSNPLVAEADKIFHTDSSTKRCAPCPETKKEDKPMCILTTSKQGEKEEVPKKDKAPSTPSVDSTTATDTKGTKKKDATEKPVTTEPEEKKPEESTQKQND